MEVCVPCKSPVHEDISSKNGSSVDPCNIDHNPSELSMHELKTCLTELLNYEENELSASAFNLSPRKNETARADNQEDLDETKSNNLESEKCFSKSATFPPFGEAKSSSGALLDAEKIRENGITDEVCEVNGNAKSVNQCHTRSVSLPTPLKLVSAMKGSREKQGIIPPKKLSITWAPDVYDPIPTSVSHVPSNKNQRYSKKYGKNKQKAGGAKSSRSSKGKDKKQVRKSSTSTKKIKSMHDVALGGGFRGPETMRIIDLNAGDYDLFCGSSFLKRSVGKLHFPVAEAT